MYNILVALLVWPCIAYATPILTADVALSCEGSEKYFSVDPRYLELENVIGNLLGPVPLCALPRILEEKIHLPKRLSLILFIMKII